MVLRSKPEKKEEKDRIRDELLRAALRLGAVHGFASLGLREVAREALIAPTSFYRHFEDMEALGLAIIRDKVEPFLLDWLGGSAADSGAPEAGQDVAPEAAASVETRANSWVAAVLRCVDEDPELARFIVAERVGSSAALRAALAEACETCGQALLGALGIHKHSRALVDGANLVILLMLEAAAQLLDTNASNAGRAAARQRAVRRIESAIAAISNFDGKT